MPIISLFRFDGLKDVRKLALSLNGKKVGNASWITAKPSRYSKYEVFAEYWWWEEIESNLRGLSEDERREIVSYLRQNGKGKILKRVYCFINVLTHTLEVYRGPDERTRQIVAAFEKLLGTNFTPANLRSAQLQKIYTQHGTELTQAMFKNVYGLIFDMLRGRYLEHNGKFRECLHKFPNCLRVISFRPRIKFLNSWNRYQVTLNGDKGTIKLSANEFKWRPRYEIRQIVFLIAAVAGWLPS
jgi:hypothetical protein